MSYIQDSQDPGERFEYDSMTSGPRPLSYRQLMALISEVLVAAWGDSWRDRFGPPAPSRELELPYIMYSLQYRSPSEKPAGNRKPMRRGQVLDREHPENAKELFGQLFDLLIEFDIFATSADEADALVEKFEEFMLTYTPFFMAKGVQDLYFAEQLEDKWDDSWSEAAHVRPIRYIFRIDRVIPVSNYLLEDVTARVNLSPLLS